MIKKHVLTKLYTDDKKSMMEIATELGVSHNQVVYWMTKHSIQRRSISDAIYQQHNPDGDPFRLSAIDTMEKAKLYGLGIGLYWGEGTKANKYAIRLGNTDPQLLIAFMDFLVQIFNVKKSDMRFQL